MADKKEQQGIAYNYTEEFIKTVDEMFMAVHAEFSNEKAEQEDKQRVSQYVENWDYYDGKMREFLKTKPGKPNDNVIVNLCSVLIDRTTARLFGDASKGEMLSFDVEKKAELKSKEALSREGAMTPDDANKLLEIEAHEYLKDVWERSGGLDKIFNSTGVYGSVTGHFAFKLVMEDEGARVVVLDPGILSVLTAPDDKDKIRAYKIEYEVYRKNPDDPNSAIKKATFRQLIVNGKYYGLDDSWYMQDFYTFRKAAGGNTYVWIVDSPLNVWQVCPIIDGQNLPHPRDYFGMSDMHNVTRLNDEINFILSNVNRIIRYHAHPRTIGIGVDPKEIQETNVESFWAVSATPDEAKIYNLEMDSDLQSTFQFFQIIREAFWTIGREADPAVFKEKIGNVTNFGLRVLYLDALNKLGQKRSTYGTAFKKLGESLLFLSNNEEFENYTLVTHWSDPLPTDPRDQVETMMMEADLGILSKETAALIRGRDWQEEKRRLEEEMQDGDLGEKLLSIMRGESPNSGSLRQYEGSKGGRPDGS